MSLTCQGLFEALDHSREFYIVHRPGCHPVQDVPAQSSIDPDDELAATRTSVPNSTDLLAIEDAPPFWNPDDPELSNLEFY